MNTSTARTRVTLFGRKSLPSTFTSLPRLLPQAASSIPGTSPDEPCPPTPGGPATNAVAAARLLHQNALFIGHSIVKPAASDGYSNRSACDGSRFAARRAGHSPAASPVSTSNNVEPPSEIGSTG